MNKTPPEPTTETSEFRPANWKTPVPWLATWFGFGLLRPAPGTMGSIGALPFIFFIMMFGGFIPYLFFGAIILAGGIWVCDAYEQQTGKEDAKEVVIDEVAGMWIACLPAMLNPILILLAFIFFRLFDILKPGPIGWCDKNVKGGWGVMLDDISAGIVSGLIIWGISLWI